MIQATIWVVKELEGGVEFMEYEFVSESSARAFIAGAMLGYSDFTYRLMRKVYTVQEYQVEI